MLKSTPPSRAAVRLSPCTSTPFIVSALLMTTLVFTACGNLPDSVIPTQGEGIVGGHAVTKKDELAKSVVALVAKSADHESLCTGTILAPDIILTAAHCVEDQPEEMVVVFSPKLNTAKAQVRPADRAAQNPAWGQDAEKGKGDLALVHFTGGLPEGYVPVTLADSKVEIVKGTDVLMIGYGVSNGLKNIGAGVLRETETQVIEAASPTEVVSDGRQSSVCFGDSGGPSFVQEAGHWVQWGVASSVTNQACNEAAVHTSIMSYLSWLKTTSAGLRQKTNRRQGGSRKPSVDDQN